MKDHENAQEPPPTLEEIGRWLMDNKVEAVVAYNGYVWSVQIDEEDGFCVGMDDTLEQAFECAIWARGKGVKKEPG